MKILLVGPSPEKSYGGMATVIRNMRDDKILNQKHEIAVHDSYIDGNIVKRLIFSGVAFVKYLTIVNKYDIIHLHSAENGSAFRKAMYANVAKRKNKKVIVHMHGAEFIQFYEGLNDKKKKKIFDFLNGADKVVALSDIWKRMLEETIHIDNCITINNGIDTDKLVEAKSEPTQYQNSFLFLGRLGKRKGAYDLVDAVEIVAKKRKDILLYMAGDGEIEEIKKLVLQKHLEDNVKVIGWIAGDEKIELMKKVSTIVLPSYNEGLPMTILEGMAAGKAIISTTAGAIPEVVQKENGIIITPGDVNALADALNSIMENKDIDAISRNNIEKIDKEFSMRRMHEKFAVLYGEL